MSLQMHKNYRTESDITSIHPTAGDILMRHASTISSLQSNERRSANSTQGLDQAYMTSGLIGWTLKVMRQPSEESPFDIAASQWQGDISNTKQLSEMDLDKYIRYWDMRIKSADTKSDVIGVIRSNKLDAIADRLDYLYEIIREDPEEGNILLQSLQEFAIFIIAKLDHPPEPEIGVTQTGYIQAVWHITGYGTLVMNFLPSNAIMFAIVFEESELNTPQFRINGVLPSDQIIPPIKEFIRRLTTR